MSFFASPRYYSSAEPNFSGLFRLIDDWDRHVQSQTDNNNNNNNNGAVQRHGGARHLPLISPKFDLKETETAYELHGELPGIEKDRVSIEFSDDQTIVVRGSIERSYTSSSSSSSPSQEESKPEEVAVKTGTTTTTEGGEPPHHVTPHPATVEDEKPESAAAAAAGKAVEKAGAKAGAPAEAPKHRFWVSERSFGEFSRSFAFPGRIDTEGVTASLANGVLTVVAPKAKKHESRRIAIH